MSGEYFCIHVARLLPWPQQEGRGLCRPCYDARPPSNRERCTCSPCTTPAFGAPGLSHCAACCGNTGINEYSYDCPDAEHAALAIRQFGPPPSASKSDAAELMQAGIDEMEARKGERQWLHLNAKDVI